MLNNAVIHDEDDYEVDFFMDENTDMGLGGAINIDSIKIQNHEVRFKYFGKEVDQVKGNLKEVETKVETRFDEVGGQVSNVITELKAVKSELESVKQMQQEQQKDSDNGELSYELINSATQAYETHQEKEVEKIVDKKLEERMSNNQQPTPEKKQEEPRKIKRSTGFRSEFLKGFVKFLKTLAWIFGYVGAAAATLFIGIIGYYLVNPQIVPPEGLAGIVEGARWVYSYILEFLKNAKH